MVGDDSVLLDMVYVAANGQPGDRNPAPLSAASSGEGGGCFIAALPNLDAASGIVLTAAGFFGVILIVGRAAFGNGRIQQAADLCSQALVRAYLRGDLTAAVEARFNLAVCLTFFYNRIRVSSTMKAVDRIPTLNFFTHTLTTAMVSPSKFARLGSSST